MPIYDYICEECDKAFERLWATASAAEGQFPSCPACCSRATRRTVSRVNVLGNLGGLTPQERSASAAEEARKASYTPKDQIQTFQANRQKKREQRR